MKYTPDILPSGFRLAYRAYPRHVGKGAALRAWINNGCEEQSEMIIKAIKSAKFSDETRFQPHMSTWINRWQWLDSEDDEDEDNEW